MAVGSCVLNDYFDRGVDRINHPERTLVQGQIRPIYALLLALSCLTTALLLGNIDLSCTIHRAFASVPVAGQPSTSYLSPPPMRWATARTLTPHSYTESTRRLLRRIVQTAVAAVVLYTPVFKPFPFLKNGVVALVIAASVALGGLAAATTATLSSLPSSLPPSLLAAVITVSCHIFHREILMDIDDIAGDHAGGILTLPRLLGKPLSLSLGGVLVAVSTWVSARLVVIQHALTFSSLFSLFNGPGLLAFRAAWGAAGPHGTAGGALGGWAALGSICVAGVVVCLYDWRVVWRGGFRGRDVERGVKWAPLAMLTVLLVLGAV